MAYTTNQLINGAYYAAGVVSREFETVAGGQISDGLQWLNEILSDKTVDQAMLPYETSYFMNAQIGVEKYFIPNLIQIDTIVFFIQDVRYAMRYTPRNQYFGTPRVENVQSLPNQWYWERQTKGGNLYIYFKPDQNYPIEIHGTFRIPPVSLNQDLTSDITRADLGVPTFYGTGELVPGQLVINDVDLNGVYPNIGALTNYINSGIIPGVTAHMVLNNFVLTSTTQAPFPIYVRTNGYPPNGTTFIGNVAAATVANLVSIYNNGSSGVGATLTAPAPAVLTVDGYVVALNDRILVKNQTNPFENGSYALTTLGTGVVPWVLTRTANYDTSVEIEEGDLFTVLNGTVNAGRTFIQTELVTEIGFSEIAFAIFNALTFSNFSTIGNPFYQIFNAIGFDEFYVTYLRYALANRICIEYNYAVPEGVVRQLSIYEAWIKKKSRIIDLKMEKASTLQKRNYLNYAFINIGKGWYPPS